MAKLNEIFLPVKGYEGLYEVSNYGRIKSCKRIVPHGRHGTFELKEKYLKIQKEKAGYVTCALCINGKAKRFKIHRLIALSFIPNPTNKADINHKNGIKTDNRIENLEWCTSSENQRHALNNGLKIPKYGTMHHSTKLTINEVKEIFKSGQSCMKLSKKYNICHSSIHDIKTGKTWSSVTSIL